VMERCQKSGFLHFFFQIVAPLSADDLARHLAVCRCIESKMDRCIAACAETVRSDTVPAQILNKLSVRSEPLYHGIL